MTRPLRIEFPDAVYHITARGNERKNIFLSDQDRELFLQTLAEITLSHNWICHAYCLMNNHYHLLIETPESNLSKGMRNLNGVYSQKFNKKHSRVGHLFQGRFKSFVIEKDEYLAEVARYIVLNPVRAGLVDLPEKYFWSSYNSTIGLNKPHECLTITDVLSFFHKNKGEAKKAYANFVYSGIKKQGPFKDLREGNILGSEYFTYSAWQTKPDADTIMEVPRIERMIGRPTLKKLFHGSLTKTEKNQTIMLAFFRCGYTQKEIADFLNLHYSTISKVIKNSRFKT